MNRITLSNENQMLPLMTKEAGTRPRLVVCSNVLYISSGLVCENFFLFHAVMLLRNFIFRQCTTIWAILEDRLTHSHFASSLRLIMNRRYFHMTLSGWEPRKPGPTLPFPITKSRLDSDMHSNQQSRNKRAETDMSRIRTH